jgi:hypothetical protein
MRQSTRRPWIDWTPLHRATTDPEALDFNRALGVRPCAFSHGRVVRAPHYGVIPPCEATMLQLNTPLQHATIDPEVMYVCECVCATQQ